MYTFIRGTEGWRGNLPLDCGVEGKGVVGGAGTEGEGERVPELREEGGTVGDNLERIGGRVDAERHGSSTSKKVTCNNTICGRRNRCLELGSCPYMVSYVSGETSTSGVLIEDVLHLKREDKYQELVEAYITFGCGEVQSGSFLDVAAPNGLFGLGMEKISVPSILSREGFIANSFSMCFGQDGVGRISFGDKGSLDQQETPFNLNPSHPTYNINVTQIRDQLRQELEMDPDLPAVLVMGGGEGMGPVKKTAMALRESLYHKEAGKPIGQGFENQMEKCMGACDCIITKVGPGTIAEALIRGLPIILNDYIPRQVAKPQSNDLKYQLIPHITRGQTNWTAKVIVVEKTPPRQSRNSVKYQNLLLIDPQGNHIEATIYQADIQALHQTLHMTKAYAISNANVKDCKLDYKKYGDLQWVITGKTKIKELQENYDDLLMSTYNFVPLSNIQQYIDLPSKEINLIAAVIDIRLKRQIHNRHGEATIQELVLVDNEITRNNCILNERITQKAYLLPATNLSPPSSNQITDISKINDMLNMVKAIAKVTNYGQPFWYMACPLCNRITRSEYGETFHCLYCKNNDLKAVPRIDVELTDSSAWITATVFGEIAETLFSCNATTLMNTKIKASDSIPNELPELHDNKEILAYIKAVKQDSTEGWKFNITSFLNTTPLSNEKLISNASTSHPNPTPLVILPEKKHKVTADDEEKKHETTNEDGNNHKASNEDQMQ
ncbi:hypothetical protein G4B88_028226 [Cannabis sativa]|uniref:Uncharacterized protein n=1 Tax=Cannabis sativa TaxID=3483 RepID=A0A7J6DYZ9_CANSA|nr:hypothetical protein G4B88_028226 [Cannabis sativa]